MEKTNVNNTWIIHEHIKLKVVKRIYSAFSIFWWNNNSNSYYILGFSASEVTENLDILCYLKIDLVSLHVMLPFLFSFDCFDLFCFQVSRITHVLKANLFALKKYCSALAFFTDQAFTWTQNYNTYCAEKQ